MALRRKKEESTNDKIVRLYQEGKSVADICAEVALRNDIVTGVIQRKLGPDAVPDAVIPHEKNPAAEVIAAANTAPAPVEEPAPAVEETPVDEMEGMSKLERYMFEKKRKAEAEANAAPAPAPAPEPVVVEPVKIPEPPVVEPVSAGFTTEPVKEEAPATVSLMDAEPEKKDEGEHKVSLVDDYRLRISNAGSTSSESEGISLIPKDAGESVTSVPSYTIPSAGEEYAEMDALVPPDLDSTDISDAPILSYDPSAEAAKEAEAPAAEEQPVAVETDKASKVADKMKAFALSQIEANNLKITELEGKKDLLKDTFSAKLDDANNALTLSQYNYDMVENKLNDAYSAEEQAREEQRVALAKADDDYRRKLEQLEEEYRAATFEANNKFQEFDDRNRKVIEELDNEKAAAQADLTAKRSAVAELHNQIGGEKDNIEAQINALKEENAGYQAFLG
ncbi:MAG: hypothetical protein IKP95_02930 [Ruminococcus sp.]|nr:hypothetical protein [Ruminococcus sp.]